MINAETTLPPHCGLLPADIALCNGGQSARLPPIKTFRCPGDPRVLDAEALRAAGGGLSPSDSEWKYVPVRR